MAAERESDDDESDRDLPDIRKGTSLTKVTSDRRNCHSDKQMLGADSRDSNDPREIAAATTHFQLAEVADGEEIGLALLMHVQGVWNSF
jgi:hypothetical protein